MALGGARLISRNVGGQATLGGAGGRGETKTRKREGPGGGRALSAMRPSHQGAQEVGARGSMGRSDGRRAEWVTQNGDKTTASTFSELGDRLLPARLAVGHETVLGRTADTSARAAVMVAISGGRALKQESFPELRLSGVHPVRRGWW